MNTIQSGMLIGLGFLVATLLGLLLAPAFWTRAVRLTSRRIKNTMPLSELEIEADRDRIRAEYAIKMHKLETLVEQVRFAAARQQIEINRRDARVNMLETDLERLQASYEEAQNARRVLEQTIADRLPRVEGRLADAKKLLHARDRELSELTRTAERHARALEEASSTNSQQQREIERLSSHQSARGGRSSDNSAAEAALRSELDALRTKTREQAQLLARMQSLAGRPAAGSAARVPASGSGAVATEASAEAAPNAGPGVAAADLERQLRTLRAANDDQAAEIARLKAAIAVFERESKGDNKGSLRESRIALKARVQALEAQEAKQGEIIVKLRSELAAANERQARQAAHFTGELRRLTPSATPGTQRGQRADASSRASLAERVAQARGGADEDQPAGDRAADRPADATADGSSDGAPRSAITDAADGAVRSPQPLPAGGAAAARRHETGTDTLEPPVPATAVESTEAGNESRPEPAAAAATPAGRPRLLDRIASLARSS